MAEAIPPTSPTPVIARPSDLLGGSTIAVGGNPGDLQAALTAALNPDGTHKGQTLVCPAGVTYSPITTPPTTGPGWTCIRSGSASLPPAGTRVGPSGSAMFAVHSSGVLNTARALTIPAGSAGWRWIGLDATHPTTTDQFGLIDADGDRLSFERCYLHGVPAATFLARCVFVHGNDVQFWDSWISEAQALGQDAQAIFTRNNARFHVENCELRGTGENLMLGDQGSASATLDVTLRRNHFFKPLTWRRFLKTGATNPAWDGVNWVIKELFEIKWAKRVLLDGNVFENNWGGQGQDGTACLASAAAPATDTSDLLYRSNTIRNAAQMFSVQTYQGVTPPTLARVAFLNNLGLQISGWLLLFNHQSDDVWVEHNTVVPADGTDVTGGGRDGLLWVGGPSQWHRQTIRRNVLGPASFGLFYDTRGNMTTALATTDLPDREWAENAVHGASGQPACQGFTFYPTAAAAGISLTDGTLLPGSPLLGAGSDGQDLGVDFAALAAAQTTPTPPQGAFMATLTVTITNALHDQVVNYTGIRVRFQYSTDAGVTHTDVQSVVHPLGTETDTYLVPVGQSGQYRAGVALTDGTVFGPELFSDAIQLAVFSVLTPQTITLAITA